MNKIIKYTLIAIAALLVLLVAAAAIIAATFDPNDYKPMVIKLVQEKKQRTLAIPGDIKLSFFPKIGAQLGKVSISEHKGTEEFAAVESAKVSLALIPLLSKQLVVDRVQVEGLRANIKRYKDGRTNYDDLLAKEEPQGGASDGGQPIALDIDSVHLGNAHIVYDDMQQARRFDIANLDLDTGKIANGVPSKLSLAANVKGNSPAIDAKVDVNTGFTLDLEKKHYVLKDLDAKLNGAAVGFTGLALTLDGDADLKPDTRQYALDGIDLVATGRRDKDNIELRFALPKLLMTDDKVTGGKLSAEARLNNGARAVAADIAIPAFEGTPQAFQLPAMVLDAAVKDDKLDAKAKVSGALNGDIDKLLFTSPQLSLTLSGKQGETALNGSLTTPLSANLKTQLIELSKLAADFTLPNPGGGTLTFKAGGNANVNLDKESVNAALKGTLDQSAFNAKLGVAGFSPMAYTFDIGIDQIDLDRYKAKTPAAGGAPAKTESKPAKEEPIDLSALQNLRATGSLRVGALKVANIKTQNVRVDMQAAGGKLDISPLAANLYGGSVAGSLSVAAGNPARYVVKQKLSGINIGPLLQDAVGKAQIEGRGNVQLDVTSTGATVTQIKKGLNGTARLELHDGAIRGVNVAQVVRNAKARIGELRGKETQETGTSTANEKTDFSEMTGSFRITNGVARNDDLNIKSPLIRIGGSGEVNLGEDRLDYLAKTTVVSTLKGQGGPELESLKGLTVPVRLTGPYTAIAWHVDFAGMASAMAKQKVDEKKEEVKAKVQEKLQERLKGLLGK
ncbi:hypothetical protein GCM10027343_12180 [Noviherbaspirillum agri]